MRVVIHHNASEKLIAPAVEVPHGLQNFSALVAAQERQPFAKAPSDEVDRIRHPPVRQPSTISREVVELQNPPLADRCAEEGQNNTSSRPTVVDAMAGTEAGRYPTGRDAGRYWTLTGPLPL